MSNYIEFNDKMAFHPGYYIKEIVDDSGLTQEEFAFRLDTTPKNLSCLVRGEQSLSIDIATKLSRMLGTSITYWLNLQRTYDALVAEYNSFEMLKAEKNVFKSLDYAYFRDNYDLPDLPRKIDEQIKKVREFLQVSSLTVFQDRDRAVSFRSSVAGLKEVNIIKANMMVQIAMNEALAQKAPKYNKSKFEAMTKYALTLTCNHADFFPLLKKAFFDAGVVFVVLPNLAGSRINGATKKIGSNILLMVNDRRLYSDTFWFTLFHEIGHIINGDYGITFDGEDDTNEDAADRYAEDALIPAEAYHSFVSENRINEYTIRRFAKSINRDPAIVLGRLQNDRIVSYSDALTNALRHKYKVISKH